MISYEITLGLGGLTMKTKKMMKLAKKNIALMKDGKIRLKKGHTIDLKPYVKDSVANSIVSRSDAIISKEEVVIDSKETCKTDLNLLPVSKSAEMFAKTTNKVPTIVIPIQKKKALDVFDYLDEGDLGIILRTSTLPAIYKQLKKSWIKLNKDDNTPFTNIMFIPNVTVLMDTVDRTIGQGMYNVNILIVAEPSSKKMTEVPNEELSDEDVSSKVIMDIMETALKVGAKNLIIDPFSHKYLNKDVATISSQWSRITSTKKCLENFENIVFSVTNEGKFITFKRYINDNNPA